MQQERSGAFWIVVILLGLSAAAIWFFVPPAMAPSVSPSPTPTAAGSAGTPTRAMEAPATASPLPTATTDDKWARQRGQMVTTQLEARDITDPTVLEVMSEVPRHQFVPADVRDQAYEDHPLPIGYGQTISQPYIVALMTQLLDLEPGDKVLEIGTGSGYQAAVLAGITDEVYTIEIIPELARDAAQDLARAGYDEVTTRNADGYFGWEEHAPFDAIIVTAAPDHVPQPLIQQLKEDGGQMVIPVGPPGGYQTLWRITVQGERVVSENITGVIFVPLTGDHPRQGFRPGGE